MASYEEFRAWVEEKQGGSIWEIQETFGVDLRTASTWLHQWLTEIGVPMQPLPETEEQWADFEKMFTAMSKRRHAPFN